MIFDLEASRVGPVVKKCGMPHDGVCHSSGSRCSKYGQTRHFNRDCPHGSLICFHYN